MRSAKWSKHCKKKTELKSRIHRKRHKWACCTYLIEIWKAGNIDKKGGKQWKYVFTKQRKKSRILQKKDKKGQESWKMIASSKENCGKKTENGRNIAKKGGTAGKGQERYKCS